MGGKVWTPSSHLPAQTTFSRVHLCLSKGLRCDLWCTRHGCDCVIYLKLSSLHANAGGNVGGSKQTSAWWEAVGGCVSAGACTPAVIKFGHLKSVLPAFSCCPCCDTLSLSSLNVILGTGAYYCFSSQRFPLKRLFLKELWRLMQSSDLSLAISSSPVTSPACSSEERLCVLHQPCPDSAARGPAVSRIHCVQGFSWVLGAWSC